MNIIVASITQIKNNFDHYMTLIENGAHLCITRYGKPHAVMVPARDYESYMALKKSAIEFEKIFNKKRNAR